MDIPEELTLDGGIYFLPKEGESQEDCRKRVREEYKQIYDEYPNHDGKDYWAELDAMIITD